MICVNLSHLWYLCSKCVMMVFRPVSTGQFRVLCVLTIYSYTSVSVKTASNCFCYILFSIATFCRDLCRDKFIVS